MSRSIYAKMARVAEREDTSGNTCWEGPELVAVAEAERHEALQLTEPFGE